MYLLDFRKLVFAQIFFWVIVTWTRARVVLDLVNTDGTIGWSASSAFLSDFDVFDGSADKIQLILSPRPEDMPTDRHVNYSAAAGLRSWDSVTYTAALKWGKNNEVQAITTTSLPESVSGANPVAVSSMRTTYMIRVVRTGEKSANEFGECAVPTPAAILLKELTIGNGSVSLLRLRPSLRPCIITKEKDEIVVSSGRAMITTYGISDPFSLLVPFSSQGKLQATFRRKRALYGVESSTRTPTFYFSSSRPIFGFFANEHINRSLREIEPEMSSRTSGSQEGSKNNYSLILMEIRSWELWLLMSGCSLFLIGSAIWVHADKRKKDMDQPVGRGEEFRNDYFKMKTFDIRENRIDDDDGDTGNGGGTGGSLAATEEDGDTGRWWKAFWKQWWAQIKRKTSSLMRMPR